MAPFDKKQFSNQRSAVGNKEMVPLPFDKLWNDHGSGAVRMINLVKSGYYYRRLFLSIGHEYLIILGGCNGQLLEKIRKGVRWQVLQTGKYLLNRK